MAKNGVIYIILMKFFCKKNGDENEKNGIFHRETDIIFPVFQIHQFFSSFSLMRMINFTSKSCREKHENCM